MDRHQRVFKAQKQSIPVKISVTDNVLVTRIVEIMLMMEEAAFGRYHEKLLTSNLLFCNYNSSIFVVGAVVAGIVVHDRTALRSLLVR